jgi:hypothetical protein
MKTIKNVKKFRVIFLYYPIIYGIIDEDDGKTQDKTLAPSVEFKNYGCLGMPK